MTLLFPIIICSGISLKYLKKAMRIRREISLFSNLTVD
jgi:hypothetical protein